MDWLKMVRDFIAKSLCITRDDLYLSPFNDSGGLGRFYELFGDGCEKLLDEMNLALTAWGMVRKREEKGHQITRMDTNGHE
jgi:type I restriction enzyme R subunit